MASVFQREDPVLYFGPRAHTATERRRYLLWPVWAWRVVAPEVQSRRLNVFQKAVLGLCRAGVVTVDHIGGKLGLHGDLAAHIVQELREQELLRHDGLPTPEGISVLQEETLESRRFVAGYVFQDPNSGRLWPRFVRELKYAQTEPGPDGFPILSLGTTGKHRPQPAFMHLPEVSAPPPAPGVTEIIRASTAHHRALRRADLLEDDEEAPGSSSVESLFIDRVSFIEERPRRVFLTTYLYLPRKDEDSDGDWYACDPFGLGPSALLRGDIQQQLPRSPPLKERLVKFLGEGARERLEEHRRWQQTLRQQATVDVAVRLTAAAERLPYYEFLVDMAIGLQEVELLGKECPPRKFRDALRAARLVAEAVFAGLLEEHPVTGVWQGMSERDREQNRAVYTKRAELLGFETPLPASLVSVGRDQLQSVSRKGSAWRLRPAAMASLLATRDAPGHPLHAAAREAPTLLRDLDDIAHIAGDAMHGGEGLSMQSVRETVDRVYRLTGLLTGLSLGIRSKAQVG